MGTRSWGGLWHLLIQLMSHEPIFVEIMAWVGVAFLAVMALEGIRSSFFPKRTESAVSTKPTAFQAADEPMTLAQAQSQIPVSIAEESTPQVFTASPTVYQTVSRPRTFRSSPRETRILGARKQSG
jgi:hypothetical protein